MTYRCTFPNCTYETELRNLIHSHHIIPKELGGTDNKGNRIYLCPNCHARIHIPESKNGIHAIKSDKSIILNSVLLSTSGNVLEYVEHGNLKYHFFTP